MRNFKEGDKVIVISLDRTKACNGLDTYGQMRDALTNKEVLTIGIIVYDSSSIPVIHESGRTWTYQKCDLQLARQIYCGGE